MKKVFTLILILFILISSFILASAEQLDFNARSYILVDAKNGQVLYEHNSNEKGLFPASTTKIMTAVLALENGNPDQIMTASKEAIYDIGKDGMNIGIMPGEEIPLKNLLEAMLISSANETANIIAENISNSRQEFIDLMNEKAREIGAMDTHFENPCGAHNKNHYTTAADMAKIAVYAMGNEEFRKIVEKKSYQMPPTNKHDSWPVLYTTNNLMKRYKNDLFRVTGIKTGYTGQAGQNLVSSAVNDEGIELIAVVMGVMQTSSKANSFIYSSQLLEYGFKKYSIQKIIESNHTVKSVYVSGAEDSSEPLQLVTSSDFKCVLPNERDKWDISVNEVVNSDITAPVRLGEKLGYIEYRRNGFLLGKVDLVASRDVKAVQNPEIIKTAKDAFQSSVLKNVIIGVLITLVSFLILRFSLKIISRKVYASKKFK